MGGGTPDVKGGLVSDPDGLWGFWPDSTSIFVIKRVFSFTCRFWKRRNWRGLKMGDAVVYKTEESTKVLGTR